MKSRSAFEFTVRKMLRQNSKLYFWTFTFREVHSLKTAMGLWNQFLTLLKRKLNFRGVRVLELHNEHGCHFHVITNQRFPIRKILAFSERYGFGRMDVRGVPDADTIRYLCKYLSKARPGCLKRARLWSAFGTIERTCVKDVLSDTPLIRVLRRVMGKPSIEDELSGIGAVPAGSISFRPEPNFRRAVEKANAVYLHGFDPDYFERQATCQKLRLSGTADLSHPWSTNNPLIDEP
jgi:hypothetical protein